jgi:hypothetical protein
MMILRMLMIMRRMIMRVTAMVVTYKTVAAEASHQEALSDTYLHSEEIAVTGPHARRDH